MIAITFMIRQLNDGGAQRQLVELVRRLDPARFSVSVITLYDGGRFAVELEKVPRVRVVSLGKKGRWDAVGCLWRLVRELQRTRPAILHGYLGLANILSVLVRPLIPTTRVVWGVRASTMDLSRYDALERLMYRIERTLSLFADLIIVNSEAGRRHAARNGFPEGRMVVIPNGFDTARFMPDPDARRRVRKEWGVGDDEKLVGAVGRLDPMKDLATFLRACALVAAGSENVRFVCVGDGDAGYGNSMKTLGEELGLGGRVIWAGARSDMPAVYNALDVLALTSITEGVPNVVGEAMACCVPCVATDVGDVRSLVGDSGVIVPPGDHRAFAAGLSEMLAKVATASQEVGETARERVIRLFGTDALAERSGCAFSGLL